MADWSLPISTTLYTGVLTALDDRLDELAKMFDGASATNLPTGTFRLDGTSNNLLQTWNGASWDNEELSVQTLLVGADGVNDPDTVTDLFFGGDANISAEGNLNLFIDSDNNTTNRLFRWWKNSAAGTGAALLMSLTEAGVLAVPGSITEGGTSLSAKYAAIANSNATHTGDAAGATALTLQAAAITGKTALTSGLAATDEFLISDSAVLKRMDVSVLETFLVGRVHTWSAKQTFGGELALNAGYSEDANTTAAGGAITLNTANATYFYTPTLTSIPTFTFSNPAASGRVTSFTLELNNGAGFAPVWPVSLEWPDGVEPSWSTGKDLVAIITRNNGASWMGFLGGVAIA